MEAVVLMDVTTELASGFRVSRYVALRATLDVASAQGTGWRELLGAFRRRVEERFLRPIAHLATSLRSRTVPGFAILALDCLLIDTIQSFREGRVAYGDVRPAKSFEDFLARPRFAQFKRKDRDAFFSYVRNALLHNGETRGDWKIRSNRSEMLSKNPSTRTRTLNRRAFHDAIVEEFEAYCQELENGTPDVRERFLRRMDAICGLTRSPDRLYFAYGSNLLEREMMASVPRARPEGVAFLPAYGVVFAKHSTTRNCDAATITKAASRIVWGYLYAVDAEDAVILQKREGGYEVVAVKVWRVDASLECGAGKPVDAFTFVGKVPCAMGCGPGADYTELLVEGARSRGLPAEYIASFALLARRGG